MNKGHGHWGDEAPRCQTEWRQPGSEGNYDPYLANRLTVRGKIRRAEAISRLERPRLRNSATRSGLTFLSMPGLRPPHRFPAILAAGRLGTPLADGSTRLQS